MFSPAQRADVRAELLNKAANDPRISGAAITGSAAAGREDRWSDVDLAFGVGDAFAVPEVLADWTAHMYRRHGALHHVDVAFGAWIYRVFLLPGTLQVDLAFAPATEFRALAPEFRLVSGKANEPGRFPTPSVESVAGLGWLYAIHVRSAIARGKLWQAESMISGVRDHALTLACLRHGLPSAHGRGLDSLPPEVLARFEPALVRGIEPCELRRAFRAAVAGLIEELAAAEERLAHALRGPLSEMADQSDAAVSPER